MLEGKMVVFSSQTKYWFYNKESWISEYIVQNTIEIRGKVFWE
jgi:hypothetical protein